MPVYATSAPAFADRRRNPRALILIIGIHAAAIAAVMSARMDLPEPFRDRPTIVDTIPLPSEPAPEPQRPTEEVREPISKIDQPLIIVPLPPLPGPTAERIPTPIPLGDRSGSATEPTPRIDPTPQPAPVRVGPRFATPDHLLKPPYPMSRLNDDAEAALKLRLSIDERGRVVGVAPVGSVDPVFFEAARKHLLARWRYKPATEDGRPVASSTVITLRFELEG